MATVSGTSGNDLIHVAGDGYTAGAGVTDNPGATDGDDVIYSGPGGSDEIHAGGGNDVIHFGNDLDAGDVIDGGSGFNTLVLDDQNVVTFGANSLHNIQEIFLPALSLQVGFAGVQNLTMNDANVAAGQTLTVDGSALSTDTFFTFDGHAETDGAFYVYGGHGNDHVTGGKGNDTFDLSTGGNDTVTSGGGIDAFVFGNALTAGDMVIGDAAKGGTVYLDGAAYAAGLVLGATTLTNITQIVLSYLGGDTSNYSLITNDGNVAAGKTLLIDASAMGLQGSGHALTFDGAAEISGKFKIIGGGGNDSLTGGGGNDEFDLFAVYVSGILQFYTVGGGSDIVHGMGGNDVFRGFNQDMTIDGGAGFDIAYASGNTILGSTAVYGATSMTSIERLVVQSVDVTMNDGNVQAGKVLQVQGDLNAASFDGSAETDGRFQMFDLYQGTWKGGAQADSFTADGTEYCSLFGNGGNDSFKLVGGFHDSQVVDGGTGTDTLVLACDLSAGVAISAAMMTSIEILRCLDGHSYTLSTADGVVASGQTLTVDGRPLSAGHALNFDGSAETDGRFILFGGAGNDSLTGGAGKDVLTGGLGSDELAGGASRDIFDYNSLAETGTTAATRDQIKGFTHGIDKIDLSTIDAVTGGGTANDTFTYVGTGAFTGAGQVRVMDVSGGILVLINTDTDTAPEASILLKGITTASIGAGDFVL